MLHCPFFAPAFAPKIVFMNEDEMKELNRQLRAVTEAYNHAPNPDFVGLSPLQIHHLNNRPLTDGCVLQWHKEISREVLDQVPLLHFATDLMQRLAVEEIKLTPKGNLPVKIVKEWYATGLIPQYGLDKGIIKIRSENNFYAATTLKHVLDMLRWTKKRKGKLSLTAKGKKALAGPRQQMLEQLFWQHFRGFNLGYFDGYEDDGTLQHFFGFVLVLLLKEGKDWKPAATYPQAMLRAFPMLEESFAPASYATPKSRVENAFTVRFLNRSLSFYGLLRFRGEERFGDSDREVMATDVFRSLFRLVL